MLKNYFLGIWLLLIMSIAVTIMLISFVLVSIFEKNTVEIINSLNKDIILKTSRTNEYVRKNIKVSGMELFFEPSVQRLMYHNELSNFDIITGLRRLDSVQSMGAHIHSIYVYNGTQNFVYSTSNFRSDHIDRFFDGGIGDLLFSGEEPMRLVPIARNMRYRETGVPVYSFVYYDPMPNRSPDRGALIININLDWLTEIIGFSSDPSSMVLFIDRNGRVIYHPDPSYFLNDFSGKGYVRTILESGTANGYFIDTAGSERKFVVYTESDEGDLFLIRIYPYEILMGRIWHLRSKISILVFLFMIMGITIAFFYSRWIYKPIRSLVTSFKSQFDNSGQNEMEYLSSSIESMISKNSSLEAVSSAYLAALRTEILKEILLGNIFDKKGIASLFREYEIPFNGEKEFRMLLVKGDLSRLPFQHSGQEPVKMETLLIREDTVFLFQDLGRAAEKRFHQFLLDSGTRLAVCSGTVTGAGSLSEMYYRCLDCRQVSSLYGLSGVLSMENRKNHLMEFEYPVDLEKQILQQLRTGNSFKAGELFQDFLAAVSSYRYEHIRFSIKRLYVSVQFLIRELQAQGYFENCDDLHMDDFENRFENIGCVEDLKQLFLREFGLLKDEIHRHRIVRIQKLAGEIETIIREEYRNPNLSTTSIADAVGLSSSYVSKMFKEMTSVSINDWISDVRIEAAKILLLEQNTSAREIACLVGFSNENYFYTLFRKKTGDTPSNFRKRILAS